MFFAELPLVLLRRWYLVVLGVLLSGVLAGVTFQSVAPTYQARAEILLLPPSTSVPKGGNPYLVLGGLEAIGGVLSTALGDQATTAELKAQGAAGDFRVGLDQTSPAPLLEVVTESTTAADSLSTLQLVVDRIPPTMEAIQRAADVSPGSFITTTPITTTQKPEVLRKSQLRVVVVVTVIGLALTLLLTAAIDGLLVRRRVRRRGPGTGAERETPTSSPTETDGPVPSSAAGSTSGALPRHSSDTRAGDRPHSDRSDSDRSDSGRSASEGSAHEGSARDGSARDGSTGNGRRENASDEDVEVLPARR
ncbi:hypothetical protein [Pedococcus bigeumensis]|uniref:Capsular polysaccharide biosynthesis protein n=1 Tax=Pedococcus bigeumensis TaxID=433644 RepID=A0A502CPV7_9MICO|nr:hypothetical protein [Pedococcus bigeumensis]TPG13836.1 hypothetical protein EAH86_16490 [Pedococcus bigeumensis]